MLIVRGQEPRARGLAAAAAPFARVVELADDPRRAHAFLPVVELFLDLVFDELALLFHHEDLFESLGEAPRALRLERPGHRHFVNPQADIARHGLRDAQVAQRLHYIAEGLSGGDDAEARLRR